MSRRYYSEIHLHLIWRTKESLPLLTPEVEKAAFAAIRLKLREYPDILLHALDGTENHVHLVVTIPPTVLICELIGQLKGFSAHEVNQPRAGKVLEWQNGYGVVSFGTKGLSWVIDYVQRQKEHHAKSTTHERLEQDTPPNRG